MAVYPESEVFSVSGPIHLSAIDWRNFDHRRSVAASLVKGVYILEKDRQQRRVGPEAQAPPWWEAMQFGLIRVLQDKEDNSIFGAIYESKTLDLNNCNPEQDSPRYVIAFRGTIMKQHGSFLQDVLLDIRCIRDRLHTTPRIEVAMEAVQKSVATVGHRNVWLAGHSLGSAIALLVAKNWLRTGYPIQTYLFNPPFPSIPVEKITENEMLKLGILVTRSVLKAGLAMALEDKTERAKQEDAFASMSSWHPYLFVNPADPICSGYMGYFNYRAKLEEIGGRKFGILATRNSVAHLLRNSIGQFVSDSRQTEPLHLIPSAYMTLNLTKSPNFEGSRFSKFKFRFLQERYSKFRKDHGIHQWWDPNSRFESMLHEF